MLRTCLFVVATFIFSLSASSGQTHSTVVATINIERAIFESNEGKHELAKMRTKAPKERQEKIAEIATGILIKMAPVIEQFAVSNGLGLIIDTSKQLPDDPMIWTKQHGGNVLRKQVDITKQIVDSYNGASVHLSHVAGDQRVLVINIEQAGLNTDDAKRQLEAIGSSITSEQKQHVLQGIVIKMSPVIAKVAEDSGADIVIDVSAKWPQGSVLWFAQQLDVTAQVVRVYDAR